LLNVDGGNYTSRSLSTNGTCAKVRLGSPLEEQLRLKLRRFIETNIPELAGKVTVKISSGDKQK
jgi:hypothetical protein